MQLQWTLCYSGVTINGEKNHVKGSLKKWTETRTLQIFAHYKVLLWLIVCFIFKLNLKWLVALKWANLPVMTLSLRENSVRKKKLGLMKYSCKIICQCLYQFIILKMTGRKQYHTSIFIQGFHTRNVHSLMKTRAIKSLHSLISVQIPLKKKKNFHCAYFWSKCREPQCHFSKVTTPPLLCLRTLLDLILRAHSQPLPVNPLKAELGLSYVYISVTQTVVNLPFPTWTYLMACQPAAAPLKASSKRNVVFHILEVVSISEKKDNLIFNMSFVLAKYSTSAWWYSFWEINMWIILQRWQVIENFQFSVLLNKWWGEYHHVTVWKIRFTSY